MVSRCDTIRHTKTHIDQTVIRKEMSECVREFIDRLPSDYKTVQVKSV
jgi:DNA-directed RNA polymerase specialized sigma24 family protein